MCAARPKTTPQAKAPFDLLPDSILLKILEYSIARSGRVVLRAQDQDYWSGRRFKNRSEEVCYWSGPQRPHTDDWILMNSINKRFRVVGKRAFYQGKSFEIDFLLLPEIPTGNVTYLKTSATRSIALQNIKDVTITFSLPTRVCSPSNLLVLPKRLRPLTGLRRCTLLMASDREPLPYKPAPFNWQKRFEAIGLPQDVKIHVISTDSMLQELSPLGPFLDAKALLLSRKRAREEDEESEWVKDFGVCSLANANGAAGKCPDESSSSDNAGAMTGLGGVPNAPRGIIPNLFTGGSLFKGGKA